MLGGMFTLYALIAGGVDTGWTFYTPYSSIYSDTYVTATVIGVFIFGFSSIFTGLNFVVTIHKMRCPGLSWMRLPLFVSANYATSIILVLATPVLAISLLLIGLGLTDWLTRETLPGPPQHRLGHEHRVSLRDPAGGPGIGAGKKIGTGQSVEALTDGRAARSVGLQPAGHSGGGVRRLPESC
jgi:hypothetical protein